MLINMKKDSKKYLSDNCIVMNITLYVLRQWTLNSIVTHKNYARQCIGSE